MGGTIDSVSMAGAGGPGSNRKDSDMGGLKNKKSNQMNSNDSNT